MNLYFYCGGRALQRTSLNLQIQCLTCADLIFASHLRSCLWWSWWMNRWPWPHQSHHDGRSWIPGCLDDEVLMIAYKNILSQRNILPYFFFLLRSLMESTLQLPTFDQLAESWHKNTIPTLEPLFENLCHFNSNWLVYVCISALYGLGRPANPAL